MSHSNERKPPMGSENDVSSPPDDDEKSTLSASEELDEISLRLRPVLCEQDNYSVISSSEDCPLTPVEPEVVDELSLRVGTLLSEIDECSIISSSEEHQDDKLHCIKTSDTKVHPFNLQVCSSVDVTVSPERDDEQIYIKDESDEADIGPHIITSCSSEMHEEGAISGDQTERHISDDLSDTRVINTIRSQSDVFQPPFSVNICDHDILKDSSSSSSSVNIDLEKRVSSYLEYPDKALSPFQSASFASQSPYFFYASNETAERISVDEKRDFSRLCTTMVSSQYSGDKEEKEFLSCSKYSDPDTPPLSASSIASSKRLEWDSAADIGYNVDTRDDENNLKKNRKEPEGFSVSTQISSLPIKYSTDLNVHLSSERGRDISEKQASPQHQSQQVSHAVDSRDVIYGSHNQCTSKDDSNITSKHNKEGILLYSSAPSIVLPGNVSDVSKERKLQILPDLSVRPKERIPTQKVGHAERKSMEYKDKSIHHGKDKCLQGSKKSEFKDLQFDLSKDIKFLSNKDSETSKKRVSFISTVSHEVDTNVSFIDHKEEKPSSSDHETLAYIPSYSSDECDFLPGSIYIDNNVLTTKDIFTKLAADSSVSNIENVPYIRWYPLRCQKTADDIKDASSQICLSETEHLEAKGHTEVSKCFDHTNARLDLSLCETTTVPYNSLKPTEGNENMSSDSVENQEWEIKTTDTPATYYSNVIEEMKHKNIILSIPSTEESKDSSMLSGHICCHVDTTQESLSGNENILQYGTEDQSFKDHSTHLWCHYIIVCDVSTQTDADILFNNYKSEVHEFYMNKVRDIVNNALSKMNGEKTEALSAKCTEVPSQSDLIGVPHPETYDVIFTDDNTMEVIGSRTNPFQGIQRKPLGKYDKDTLRKFRHQQKRIAKSKARKKMIDPNALKVKYQEAAKSYSKELAKRATKGITTHDIHARIVDKKL